MERQEYDEAERLARGEFGSQIGRYPFYYCQPILIVREGKRDEFHVVTNGTVTLLELGDFYMGVTCAHVIDPPEITIDDHTHFVIGKTPINDISKLVIDKSPQDRLDIATLDLTGLGELILNQDGWIGSRFVLPYRWPPTPVEEGHTISVGGFPGSLRQSEANQAYTEASGVNGAHVVNATEKIYAQFERDSWVYVGDEPSNLPMDFTELGGVSGGPAFLQKSGVEIMELVGIVVEFSGPVHDLVQVTPISCIGGDGTITPPN